jgi:hypothetical protein
MTNARRPGNAALRGWFDRHGRRRRGKHQIAVWRCLVANSVVTTRDLVEYAFPRVTELRRSHWVILRRAAERFAVRLVPHSRPLRWCLKDEFKM